MQYINREIEHYYAQCESDHSTIVNHLKIQIVFSNTLVANKRLLHG